MVARHRYRRQTIAVETGAARRLDARPRAAGSGPEYFSRMVVDAAVNSDARTEIMMRIRAALRTPLAIEFADLASFEPAETVPADEPKSEALSARFARELELVGGEAIVVGEKGI